MGIFIDVGNTGFQSARKKEYIDKSGLLSAIILELKYDLDADAAIDQILRRQYPAKVLDYSDNLLLVGINYDKKDKTHRCKIMKYPDD